MVLSLQQVYESEMPAEEQQLFKQSVIDDLRELTVNTISELGISGDECNAWKLKF